MGAVRQGADLVTRAGQDLADPVEHLRRAARHLVSPSVDSMSAAGAELEAAVEALRLAASSLTADQVHQWRIWLWRASRLFHHAGALSFGAASILFQDSGGYTDQGRLTSLTAPGGRRRISVSG